METLEQILTRFGSKIAGAGEQDQAGQGTRPRLLPDRHPVRDFFIADILDWALKDDRHSMEHPMFSLSKKPDRRIRRYEHNGVHITVAGAYGLATIWDKDILLYCTSVLMEGLNQGRKDVSGQSASKHMISWSPPIAKPADTAMIFSRTRSTA